MVRFPAVVRKIPVTVIFVRTHRLLAWLGHAVELASIGLFGWCWIEERGTHRGRQVELLIAVAYGWILETFDLRLFGSYHYEPVTWWWVGGVPLYIPLLWAAILHSSMALSDRAGLPTWARPFLDGLLAVVIDMAVDAIAIRTGFWRWNISLHEGWFGVPAGNLCAWMWVAVWYGSTMRWMRQRVGSGAGARWFRVFVPPVSYLGLLLSLWLIGFSGRLLGLERQNERLWFFAAHLVAFLLIVVIAKRWSCPVADVDRRVPESLLCSRWLIHGSFTVILWASGLWRQVPALILVCASSLLLEWSAQRWVMRRAD